MTVSPQDVDRIADLANLELTGSEKAAIGRDLNSLLDYFGELNELDTNNVPAMTQVAQSGEATSLRADEVVPSLDREKVLACAPDTDHVFFKVPKVIER